MILRGTIALLALCVATGILRAQDGAPAGMGEMNLRVTDAPWDNGKRLVVRWSPLDDQRIARYRIDRTMNARELADDNRNLYTRFVEDMVYDATRGLIMSHERASDLGFNEMMTRRSFSDHLGELIVDDALPNDLRRQLRRARAEAAEAGDAAAAARIEELGETRWLPQGTVDQPATDDELEFVVTKLERVDAENQTMSYRVRVMAVDDALAPILAVTSQELSTVREPFDGTRLWMMIITGIICGAIMMFIAAARSGKSLYVRRIAGLEAVEEAVGRATEMGRPVLFVPGIQDVNEIQTIAGLTMLNRVAKISADFDARIEVPTARSLVMTAARETVEGAYVSAGRPDAYNPDDIYYVSNEQFGYVAYLSGMMVRDEPAACFYMGAFYAESLILAETGNAIGAIQIAGTAQPAQLPFFIAACDYTLIGEEFYAASAYLSGSPEQLGSLKGQDVGKVVAAILVAAGVLFATLVAVGIDAAAPIEEFITGMVLR